MRLNNRHFLFAKVNDSNQQLNILLELGLLKVSFLEIGSYKDVQSRQEIIFIPIFSQALILNLYHPRGTMGGAKYARKDKFSTKNTLHFIPLNAKLKKKNNDNVFFCLQNCRN